MIVLNIVTGCSPSRSSGTVSVPSDLTRLKILRRLDNYDRIRDIG